MWFLRGRRNVTGSFALPMTVIAWPAPPDPARWDATTGASGSPVKRSGFADRHQRLSDLMDEMDDVAHDITMLLELTDERWRGSVAVHRVVYDERSASVAFVRDIRSSGTTSTWRPRRPADTNTVGCSFPEASRNVGMVRFCPNGLIPPTT